MRGTGPVAALRGAVRGWLTGPVEVVRGAGRPGCTGWYVVAGWFQRGVRAAGGDLADARVVPTGGGPVGARES